MSLADETSSVTDVSAILSQVVMPFWAVQSNCSYCYQALNSALGAPCITTSDESGILKCPTCARSKYSGRGVTRTGNGWTRAPGWNSASEYRKAMLQSSERVRVDRHVTGSGKRSEPCGIHRGRRTLGKPPIDCMGAAKSSDVFPCLCMRLPMHPFHPTRSSLPTGGAIGMRVPRQKHRFVIIRQATSTSTITAISRNFPRPMTLHDIAR